MLRYAYGVSVWMAQQLQILGGCGLEGIAITGIC